MEGDSVHRPGIHKQDRHLPAVNDGVLDGPASQEWIPVNPSTNNPSANGAAPLPGCQSGKRSTRCVLDLNPKLTSGSPDLGGRGLCAGLFTCS